MQGEKRPLVILTGPTAVGKTKLSVQLAKKINGEIISADSMQVYRMMDIGTAKVKKEETEGVKHYLIDCLDPSEEFNVLIFQKLAKEAMEEIYSKGKIPIIVGGTGFYIQAVLYDIHFSKEQDNQQRRLELEEIANEKGAEYLHAYLEKIDPLSAGEIHANNIKRTIRAIEFFEQNHMSITLHNEEERLRTSPYNFSYFVLNTDREKLYHRIEMRIDQMMSEGLLDEVRGLKEKGYDRNLVSMQGLGYKEMLAYLENEISLEDAVYILKRDTRHFAKRQLTWFRREKETTWIQKDDYMSEEEILLYMMEELEKKGIL